MTYIRITSMMAMEANCDPGARIAHGGLPYPSIKWEGEVDLSDAATDTAKLEKLFRLFNRVTPDDDERLARVGYKLPSLSVGDNVEMEGTVWKVAPVGWEVAV